MQDRTFRKARFFLTATTLAALLAGCGGGGGSSNVRPSDSGGDIVEGYANDEQLSVDGDPVTVGVTDTGLRTTHEQFDGKVVDTYNVVDGSSDVSDSEGHGTQVSGVLAGKDTGYSGNAELMMVYSADTHGELGEAVEYAADNGASIINTSSSGWEIVPEENRPRLQAVEENDVVWNVAAGNGGQALTEKDAPSMLNGTLNDEDDANTIFDHDYKDNVIIAGALNEAEDDIASFSSYPGINSQVQDRFLLAAGENLDTASAEADNSYTTISGTSAATPVISAAASLIRSKWPHLSAEETASLLLDTADRSFVINPDRQYGDTTCGEDGNSDCGLYYYGQGRLDVDEALKPLGTASVVTTRSVTVEDGGADITETRMATSPAFGDAFSGVSALENVAVFDSYGRDFRADLTEQVSHRTVDFNDQMAAFMEQQAGRTELTRYRGMTGMVQYGADGQAYRGIASKEIGSHQMAFYSFNGDSKNPLHIPKAAQSLPMLSLRGEDSMRSDLGAVVGAAANLSLTDSVSFGLDRWQSDVAGMNANDDHGLRRTEATITYHQDGLRLTAGAAHYRESGRFLGTYAEGGLSLGETHAITAATLRAEYSPSKHLGVFLQHEQGAGHLNPDDSIIRSVDGIRTAKSILGVAYNAEETGIGFSVSRPLRVTDAQARFSVPVGRRLDGTVVRDTMRADLSPSGAQTNYEVALRRRVNDTTRVQANLLHVREPGHDASAGAQTLAMVGFKTRF